MSNPGTILDATAVGDLLPQKPPLLLVDRVTRFSPGVHPEVEAGFSISVEHPVLVGHFPGRPVWPGSYTIEGLAQTCALAGMLGIDRPALALAERDSQPPVMVAAVKVKLLQPVVPPALLVYRAIHTHAVGQIHRFNVEALCSGIPVAAGSLDVVVFGWSG